jgi:hypothetical protein
MAMASSAITQGKQNFQAKVWRRSYRLLDLEQAAAQAAAEEKLRKERAALGARRGR